MYENCIKKSKWVGFWMCKCLYVGFDDSISMCERYEDTYMCMYALLVLGCGWYLLRLLNSL